MEDLTTLCQNELIKNPKIIDNLSHVPYRLIKRVFEVIHIKVDQLLMIERSNVFYIFEDDDIWLGLLKSEFPGNVHDSFISDGKVIREYYTREFAPVMETLSPLERERFKLCLHEKLRRDLETGKYRIPYRMLYFQYQEDIKRREAESAEKLRLTVQKINKERERKQTAVVDYSYILKSRRHGSRKRVVFWGPGSEGQTFGSSSQRQKKMITMTMTKKPERLAFGGAAGGLVQQNCYNNSPGEKVGANPGDAGHNPCGVPVNKERESSGCTASVSQLQQVVHPTRAPVARRQHPKDQNIFLSTIKKRPPSVPRTHEPISALKTKHVRDNTSATSAQPHIGTKKKRSLIFNSSGDRPTPVIRVRTRVRSNLGGRANDTDRTPSMPSTETEATTMTMTAITSTQARIKESDEASSLGEGNRANSSLTTLHNTRDSPPSTSKKRKVTTLKNYLTRHQK